MSSEHLKKIYDIICQTWSFYKSNFEIYKSNPSWVTKEAEKFWKQYENTPECDFARNEITSVIGQFQTEQGKASAPHFDQSYAGQMTRQQQENMSVFFNDFWVLVKRYGIAEDDDNEEWWNDVIGRTTKLAEEYHKTIPKSVEYIIIKNLLCGFMNALDEQNKINMKRKSEK